MSKQWNIEAMADILESYGLSSAMAAEIADDFESHLRETRDMDMTAHVGGGIRCRECERKDARIADLERQLDDGRKSASEWKSASYKHLGVINEIFDSPDNATEILRQNDYRYR